MGTHNPCLSIDSNLITASLSALNTFSKKCANECDLEDEVRSHLCKSGGTLHLGGELKKCCGLRTGRKNSDPFQSKCELWDGSNWKTSNNTWHNDVYCTHNSKRVIVEIKIISKGYMDYLMGGDNLAHTVPDRFHFKLQKNLHTSKISIDKPIDKNIQTGVSYYSHLAEGQLWLDILRLKQAKSHFKKSNTELYLLLFSDTHVQKDHLEVTLNSFGAKKKGCNYLYHNYRKQIFRSKIIDFSYNYQSIPPHPLASGGPEAFLVRVEPTSSTTKSL